VPNIPSSIHAPLGPRRFRGRWQLTAEALRRLLARLAADEEEAAAKYENLRRKLLVYFHGIGRLDADVCADETLDRVARRLQREHIDNVAAFVRGVARYIAMEGMRRDARERRRLEEWRPDPAEGTTDARLILLEEQLRRLPSVAADLLVEYYSYDSRRSQESRRHLAQRLGTTYGALKMRVHRMRADLAASLHALGDNRGHPTGGRCGQRSFSVPCLLPVTG